MGYYDEDYDDKGYNENDYGSENQYEDSEYDDSGYDGSEYEDAHQFDQRAGNLDKYNDPYSQQCNYQDTLPEGRSRNKISDIADAVASNKDILNKTLDLGKQIADVYAESQRLNAQVEIVKEASKVKLAQIAAKFLTTKDVLDKVFSEREKSLSEDYKALNYGIETGNTDLIIKAMGNISSIVVSSPLADINNFIERMEDTSMPLLDF